MTFDIFVLGLIFKLQYTGYSLIILYVTRIKRSNSQDLEDKMDEFKRNGLRSTTGGRLGWSKEVKYVLFLFALHWSTGL